MRLIQSGNVPVAVGKYSLPAVGRDPGEGRAARELSIKLTVPVKNTSGGTLSFTKANLISVLDGIFGAFTMGWARGNKRVLVDVALSFAELREMHMRLTGRDFLVNGVQLDDFVSTSIAAGVTTDHVVYIKRAFWDARFGADAPAVLPGRTQCSMLAVDINRTSVAYPANFSENGTPTWSFFWDDLDDDGRDDFAQVPRLFQNEDSGLTQRAPGGILLAAWDRNAVASATSIGIITVGREGDEPLHDQIAASDLDELSAAYTPPGTKSLALLATPLYETPQEAKLGDLVCASGYFVRQAANTVALKTRWLYIPTWTDEMVEDVHALLAATEGYEGANLTRGPALRRYGHLDPAIAACLPISILRPDDDGFEQEPGRSSIPGEAVTRTFVPPTFTAAIRGSLDRAPSSAVQTAQLVRAGKALASAIPGAGSGQRRKFSGKVGQLVADAAGPNLHGAVRSAIAPRLQRLGNK